MRQLRLFVFPLLMAALTGCSSTPKKELHRFEVQQPHMGTMFTITMYAPDEFTARSVSGPAFARVAKLDQMMTDYDPDSELMQLCKLPPGQPHRVSDELFEVLAKAQQVAELSNGAFDITIGPVVRLWRRARRLESLPIPELLAEARQTVGWKNVKLNPANKTVTLAMPGMQLDLGGLAKGYAADQALAVLKARGISRAVVAASGDLAIGDPPPGQRGWRIGIGAPTGGTNTAGGTTLRNLLLSNAAISTSGDSEQFVVINGQRYSHIVDPRTGVGLTETFQVSVVTRRGIDSDSLDTAVSVMGLAPGLKMIESLPNVSALLVRRNGDKLEVTESSQFKRLPRAPLND